jgi:hypothetical protein
MDRRVKARRKKRGINPLLFIPSNWLNLLYHLQHSVPLLKGEPLLGILKKKIEEPKKACLFEGLQFSIHR